MRNHTHTYKEPPLRLMRQRCRDDKEHNHTSTYTWTASFVWRDQTCFLGSRPEGNRRGKSPVEYRGSMYVPSVCPSVRTFPTPTAPGLSETGLNLSEAGSGLSEAGSGLSGAGSGLSEAGSGLSAACSGLSAACSGLAEAGSGLSEDGSGLSEASSGLFKASPGLLQAGSGLSEDGQTYGRDVQIPPIFYRTLSCLPNSFHHKMLEQGKGTEDHLLPLSDCNKIIPSNDRHPRPFSDYSPAGFKRFSC